MASFACRNVNQSLCGTSFGLAMDFWAIFTGVLLQLNRFAGQSLCRCHHRRQFRYSVCRVTLLVPDAVSLAVTKWREELERASGRDALIAFEDHVDETLDLDQAHPNGLAQFLAGRDTRLSLLFRQPSSLSQARRRARTIRVAAEQLAERHGVHAAHLVSGLATWQSTDATTGAPLNVNAPILLHPLGITARGGEIIDDDLHLMSAPRVNPALVRLLQAEGVSIDPGDLQQRAGGGHGFNPRPSYNYLKDRARSLPGFKVVPRTVVGIFFDVLPALLSELDDVPPKVAGHPVLRQFADREVTRRTGADVLPGVPPVPPEVLPCDGGNIFELDDDQRLALGALAEGHSIRVSAPPGTGATQVVAQAVATQLAAGKRTLVVSARPREIVDLQERLAVVGLVDVVTEVGAPGDVSHTPEDAGPGAFAAALADDGDVESLAGTSAADTLADLVEQRIGVHKKADPWGVSAQDCLEALTVLTRGSNGPKTTVRLPAAVIGRLTGDERDHARDLLESLAGQGGFTDAVRRSPWWAASLHDQDAAREALAAAKRLATGELLFLVTTVLEAASQAGLAQPANLRDGRDVVGLLDRISLTLEIFRPDVYSQPLEELLASTASRTWRDEHGIKMGMGERRRFRKQARNLVRPDTHVSDLHSALAAALQERQEWKSLAGAGGWPQSNVGLADVVASLETCQADLDLLDQALASTPEGDLTTKTPLEDLVARVESLAADDTSETLPERITISAELAALGLGDLMIDLGQRDVPIKLVPAEFDLCWWTSVLEMLLSNTALPMPGERLLEAYQETRHRESLAQAATLAKSLRGDVRHDGKHCLAVTPLRVPELGDGVEFDLVIVAAAHSCAVPEGVLALARGAQSMVIGDPVGIAPRGVDEAVESAVVREPLLDVAADAMPTFELTCQHRMPMQLTEVLPKSTLWAAAAPDNRLFLTKVSAKKRSQVDLSDGISGDQEVTAVTDAVLDHVRLRPKESLAVIGLTRQHARRVADAVRAKVVESPELLTWFTSQREPFVVTDVTRCEDIVRDQILLSVGLTRTEASSLDDVLQHLAKTYADRTIAAAVSRARLGLHVFSSITADDLAGVAVHNRGAAALRHVLSVVESPAECGPTAPVDGLRPLVADFAARLGRCGFDVLPTGGAHGWPDLAVLREGGRPVAVMTDGRWPQPLGDDAVSDFSFEQSQALVLDDAAVMSHLERFGWETLSLTSLDAFSDEASAIAAVQKLWGRR